MTDMLCPGCGCSLVRLGIPRERATEHTYDGQELHFCCEACVDVFRGDPARFLRDVEELAICPTCLSEKPKTMTVTAVIDGREFRFCRCPTCIDLFRERPDVFVQRLTGTIAEALPTGPHCC